jgi:type IV secretory pathway TrbD component
MKNLGSADKVVRIAIAVVAAVLALVVGGGWGIVLWVVAAIMVLTAVVGVCPIYKAVGLSTRKSSEA